MADETGGLEVPITGDASPVISELGKVALSFKALLGDADAFGERFEKVFGAAAEHLKTIRTLASAVSSGGANSLLANAGVQGTGNQLKASELGQDVQLIRQQVSLQQQINQLAKEAAGYIALERGEIEKTTALDKARLEVAQAQRSVREQIAKGPKDLSLEQSLPLVQRLTEAYANLGRVQREGRDEKAAARASADEFRVVREGVAALQYRDALQQKYEAGVAKSSASEIQAVREGVAALQYRDTLQQKYEAGVARTAAEELRSAREGVAALQFRDTLQQKYETSVAKTAAEELKVVRDVISAAQYRDELQARYEAGVEKAAVEELRTVREGISALQFRDELERKHRVEVEKDNAARERELATQRQIAELENREFDLVRKAAEAREKSRERDLALQRQVAEAENRDFDKVQRAAEARVAAKEKELALDRADAEQQNRQHTLQQRAAGVVDPALALQNAAGRTAAADRLFGDGGQQLFQIQTRLYAQYTIIRTVLSAMQGLVGGVLDLDQAFRELQAISGATDTQMKGLEATLLDIGETTRFSLAELAQAATTMAQAGLSAQQIQVALQGTTQLATASGSSLASSVDVMTSALSVFNLRAEETPQIANAVTSALNLSKLTVDKLAVGLQYAGNIAADAGDSFNQTLAVLATLSNAGIRNGSTLGTEVRQLYTDLEKPSAALEARFALLGLTAEQTDVKTNGLIGTLRNLAAAGFSTGDAIATMQTRAAAGFTALARNLGQIDEYSRVFTGSTAAVEAAGVQMEGLEAKLGRLRNSVSAVAFTMAGDFDHALGRATDAASGAFQVLDKYPKLLEVIGTAVAALAVGGLAVTAARFTGLSAAAKFTASALVGIGEASTLAEAAAGALAFALNPVVLVATTLFGVVGYLTNGFGLWSSAQDEAAGKLEAIRTGLQDTKGKIDGYQTSIESVDKATQDLVDHAGRLNNDQGELNTVVAEAKSRFGELGLSIDGVPKSIDGLLQAYGRLKATLNAGLGNQFLDQVNQIGEQAKAVKAQVASTDRTGAVKEALVGYGIPPAVINTNPKGALNQLGVGNPDLADALRRYSSQSPDLDLLQASRTALASQRNQGGQRPEEADVVNTLLPKIDALIGQLKVVAAAPARQEIAQGGADLARFNETHGAAIDQSLRTGEAYFNTQVTDRLSGVTDATARKKIAQDLMAEALAVVQGNLQRETAGLSSQDQGFFHQVFDDKVKTLQTHIFDKLFAGTIDPANREIDAIAQARTQELTSRVQQLAKRLGGKSTGDDASVIAQIKPLLDQKRELLNETFSNEAVKKGLPADIIAQHRDTVDKEIADEMQGYLQKVATAGAAAARETLQNQLKVVDARIALIQRRFTGKNPSATDADSAELQKLYDQQANLQDTLTKNQGLDPKNLKLQLEANRLSRETAKEAQADRLLKGDNRPTFDPKFFEQDLSASLGKPFTLIQKSAETQAKALAEPLKALQAEIGELDKPGIAERVPSFLKDRLGRKAQGLQDDQLQAEGGNSRAEQLAIKAQTDQLRSELADLTVRSGEMEAKLQEAAGQPKTPDLERLQADYTQVTTRVQRLNEAIATGDQLQEAAAQKADEAALQLQARAEALAAEHMSVGETVAGAYDAWARSAGVLDGKVKIIGDTATATFGAMRDGVAQWVVSVANGTETVGGAFKSLGVSILQTLEKIAAERFADYLIGAVFGAFLGPKAPGVGTGGNTLAGGNGSLTFGGPRAGGGPITGGTPGRDSVLTPSMPGEWVLRKGAVDMIGRDVLATMNKTGRIPVAKARSIVPIPVPQGGGGTVNVWSVHPDQVPPPSEQDVIAYVHRDIMTGGATKRLIHSVALGQM